MASSCYNPSNLLEASSLMSQSLDPSLLNETITTPTQTKQSLKELNGALDQNFDGKGKYFRFPCIIL